MFSQQYPEFCLSVKVLGDQTLNDQCYQTYKTQLMFNPWKANQKKMPGLSLHSKLIKKKKKPAFVAEEEGEAGGELSDELM